MWEAIEVGLQAIFGIAIYAPPIDVLVALILGTVAGSLAGWAPTITSTGPQEMADCRAESAARGAR